MSAFIVSPETMQFAVAAFAVSDWRAGELTCANADKLGQDLYQLNFEAIHQRYPDTVENGNYPGPIDVPVPEDFEFRLTQYSANTWDNAQLVPAYKALSCLSYQCGEGNVPETELYHRMDAVLADLAARIVSNLPEYKTASWDA